MPAQGLFLREAEHTAFSDLLGLVGSSCCQDFGTSRLRVELSELCHRKRDLVLKEKGPHLRTAVQGKSPFSLSKALHTVCSEKKYTSLSDSQEAVWQDAEHGNKLTLSLRLAAILILSQAALTMYICLFVWFF